MFIAGTHSHTHASYGAVTAPPPLTFARLSAVSHLGPEECRGCVKGWR